MSSKNLILLRHAKSSWKHENLLDIERPLNKDGLAEMTELLDWLSKRKIKVDQIVCSPSARTYHTMLFANRKFKVPQNQIEIDQELYESTLEQYVNSIKKTNPKVNTLLIVGHNPVCTQLAKYLANYDNEVLTGNLLRIEIKKDYWKDIQKNCGDLIEEFIPSRH